MIIETTDVYIGLLFLIGFICFIIENKGLNKILIKVCGVSMFIAALELLLIYGYFGYRYENTKDYLIRETTYGYLIENGSNFIKIEDHQSVVFIKAHPKDFRIYTNRELFGNNCYIATY